MPDHLNRIITQLASQPKRRGRSMDDRPIRVDECRNYVDGEGDSDVLEPLDETALREQPSTQNPDFSQWQRCFPMPSFRKYQEETIQKILEGWASGKRYAIVEGTTGCHAKGTKVLMYDGTCKVVEDIEVNDLLMGPDSQPRIVKCLHRGRQEMVKIIPTKGRPFVVNLDHILSLQRTPKKSVIAGARKDFKGVNPLLSISVRDWLLRSKTFKHTYKLYRKPVNFTVSRSELTIPPYILGLWLGDGTSKTTELTTMDEEIRIEWFAYAQALNLNIVSYEKNNNRAKTYRISKISQTEISKKWLKKELLSNYFKQQLTNLNLLRNKHIPYVYLTASRQDRLELLAGLLDTDGSLSSSCFDFIQKRKQLSRQVCFLARSLGFAAYLKRANKSSQTGSIGEYWRVSISGDTHLIPTRLPHKQASRRQMDKNVLRTGFTVERLPEDDYFGFEITYADNDDFGYDYEGEHLYLLDDFTVCHNSGKSAFALTLGRLFESAFLATPQKMLQNQYMKDFKHYLCELKGRANYPCLRLNYALWRDPIPGTGKNGKNIKYRDRDPEVGEYMSLREYNNLPPDAPQRSVNCANAKCNSSRFGLKMKAECKKHRVCEYIRRRDYAMKWADLTLMNFSNLLLFSLLMENPPKDRDIKYNPPLKPYDSRSLLMLDECHTLESFLYEFASITVGLSQLKRLTTFVEYFEDVNRITQPFTMEEFVAYINDVIIPASDRYELAAQLKEKEEKEKFAQRGKKEDKDEQQGDDSEQEEEEGESLEDQVTLEKNDERAKVNKLAKKLQEFVDSKPTEHSYVLVPLEVESEGRNFDSKKERIGVTITPFSVAHLGERLAFKSSHSRVLLMSATILDPKTFCKSVGIPLEKAFFIRVPSTFPPANRLIIGDLSVGSMTYYYKDKTMPKMLDRLLELSEKHQNQKGIIHTGNYENMSKLQKWARGNATEFYERLLFPDERTFEHKSRLLDQHTNGKEPTILCGPGFIEGLNLKDDLARFNILMKLPFMSLANPLIKRKALEFPEWYALQTALAIIQAIGRSVRSEIDWSVIYILDLAWKAFYVENKNVLFPNYIQEAIRWVSTKHPVPYK